jgi:tRNA A37 threonylcarbamoyladenosine synthetase subunit TsaC/SUA5/YrdC
LTLLLPLRTDNDHEIDFSLISPTPVIGIRFLDHPFQEIVTQLWKPFITTSANISWQPNIIHPDQLVDEQKQLIDFCVDEGTIDRPASVIINYTTQEVIRG